eukprot:638062-Prymnesium_polylepis.2
MTAVAVEGVAVEAVAAMRRAAEPSMYGDVKVEGRGCEWACAHGTSARPSRCGVCVCVGVLSDVAAERVDVGERHKLGG